MSKGRDKPRVGELRPSQMLTTFGVGSVVDLPHISVMDEIDASALFAVRAALRSELPELSDALTPAVFFAAAVAEMGERERLLVAMAGLPPELRAEVEALAAQNDMPLAPLYGALLSAACAAGWVRWPLRSGIHHIPFRSSPAARAGTLLWKGPAVRQAARGI